MKYITDYYFDYLVVLAGGEEHHILFRKLFDISFYSDVIRDVNRASDGLDLRDDWIAEDRHVRNNVAYHNSGQCSVLEMLIALAKRYIFVSGHDLTVAEVMELFLKNLGLWEYFDRDFDDICEKEVDKKVRKFLDRKYTKTGRGSLFPLSKRTEKDMRNEEIWYQMNYYLIEKYDE